MLGGKTQKLTTLAVFFRNFWEGILIKVYSQKTLYFHNTQDSYLLISCHSFFQFIFVKLLSYSFFVVFTCCFFFLGAKC